MADLRFQWNALQNNGETAVNVRDLLDNLQEMKVDLPKLTRDGMAAREMHLSEREAALIKAAIVTTLETVINSLRLARDEVRP